MWKKNIIQSIGADDGEKMMSMAIFSNEYIKINFIDSRFNEFVTILISHNF